MLDKHKDKIKKLLELSLSDNEHEAGLALKQAMALMNKHNLTKDEIYKQNMVSEEFSVPYFRVPGWYSNMTHFMSELSGCFCVYINGDSYSNEYAKIQIVGRQQDVENSIYLITFLSREIERHVAAYKHSLTIKTNRHHTAALVKSFRVGFIKRIYSKMRETQHQFFREAEVTNGLKGNELVCVNTEARVFEAKAYYVTELGLDYSTGSSRSTYYETAMQQGQKAAEEVSIHQAVYQQNEVKQLSYQ